jgi:hypothetical protein
MTNLLGDSENLRNEKVLQLFRSSPIFGFSMTAVLKEFSGSVNTSPRSIYTLGRVSWRNANPMKIGEPRIHCQTFSEILRLGMKRSKT